jgi:hypothetical protein
MENSSKKFYFQEMDWIITFPNSGNEGRKYLFYSAHFIDRKNKRNMNVLVADILDNPMFENGCPHTVGFFKGPVDEDGNFEKNFLELRIIRCIEEFWKFLNDLNI